MTGRAGICSKSLSEACAREAAVETAAASVTNPAALLALRVFDTFESQWRPGFTPIGLDYPAILDLSPRLLRIEVDDEIFAYLQVLELEQLDAWKTPKAGGTSR